jgi:hypothetical protein
MLCSDRARSVPTLRMSRRMFHTLLCVTTCLNHAALCSAENIAEVSTDRFRIPRFRIRNHKVQTCSKNPEELLARGDKKVQHAVTRTFLSRTDCSI